MGRRGETIGAVDFGSRDIRVLIARQDYEGAIAVIGHGTAPADGCVSQGVIQDREAAQLAFRQALVAAEREARVRVPSLFCGINGRNVETCICEGNVHVEREVVEEDHLIEARDIASRDVLSPGRSVTSSITAQEWYVDEMRVLNPIGMRGQVLKTRMHFARIPTVIEENILSCIESQRRELEDLIFLPLAASLGCLTHEDKELGVAVLDMGRTTTGLAVYRDERILGTHVFDWGGYHITRDVAAGLQVSFDEADELVLEYGIPEDSIAEEFGDNGEKPAPRGPRPDGPRIKLKTAVPGAPTIVDRLQLEMIVFERVKELMLRMRQHLKSRGLARNLVRGVVLTGGAARIRNMPVLAEAVFQVPSRVGMPTSVDELPHAVMAPEYSSVVGIVHHGFQYRDAARNGQVEPRGAAVSVIRRMGRFAKRYFL